MLFKTGYKELPLNRLINLAQNPISALLKLVLFLFKILYMILKKIVVVAEEISPRLKIDDSEFSLSWSKFMVFSGEKVPLLEFLAPCWWKPCTSAYSNMPLSKA